MNTDSRERLQQIRRWSRVQADMEAVAAKNHISPMESKYEKRLRDDIDFLLSVLDSPVDPRPHGNQHYPYCARHEGGNYEAKLACTCYDYPLVAATTMREACVAAVEKIADEWFKSGNSVKYDAARAIRTALTYITLDQVEQEKTR